MESPNYRLHHSYRGTLYIEGKKLLQQEVIIARYVRGTVMTVDSASVSWNLHDFRLSVLQADAKKRKWRDEEDETGNSNCTGFRLTQTATKYTLQLANNVLRRRFQSVKLLFRNSVLHMNNFCAFLYVNNSSRFLPL